MSIEDEHRASPAAKPWSRRQFVANTGTVAAATLLSPPAAQAMKAPRALGLVLHPDDTVANSQPVTLAIVALKTALSKRGIAVKQANDLPSSSAADLLLVACSSKFAETSRLLTEAGVDAPVSPEALVLAPHTADGKHVLVACGADARGLSYAIRELADLCESAPDPLSALLAVQKTAEAPANKVRSLTRLFCSDVEDKPWYNDRAMWPEYFDMLASQRFNRFNLAFGIGYDFIRKVTDAYFLFTYPFLLKVPGYDVRVPQLPDAEREQNLEMLRYISEQCVMRGIEFHVGLWMHGYVWIDSPAPNYTIEGLNKETHGPYCRDAVRMLLKEVPNIQGLTFRIHGESGVEEGSFTFWKTVFDGVASCGRRVPIDMHTKGMTEQMIGIGLNTGQPLQLSPKFWAEHMGMTYHQADIRQLEKPKAQDRKGLMAMSDGTRSFLRYGYGDLLPEDRKWTVVHRIWPGTQRVLLWGDPQFAAAYSRAFSFCGSDGVEVMEMLSFKGRRGSGHAGDRCAYQDATLRVRWDWQKYEYGTRVWGRMLYNPDTSTAVLRRPWAKQFGPGAAPLQTALANVSRILPIVTTAHAPSAGNNTYWPELYFNQSMVDAVHYGPYGDSPQPRVFGTVSPLDPKLFYTINDYVDDLISGSLNGRYSPVEVATWIETFAATGCKALSTADAVATGRRTAAYRRAKVDILMQAGLGDFFAAKLRSGVLFRIYEKTKDPASLRASIERYKAARNAWAEVARVGTGVYMTDITLGEEPQLRGHWADRLPAMDRDIAALSDTLASAAPVEASATNTLIAAALSSRTRPVAVAQHSVPLKFTAGATLPIRLTPARNTTEVSLHYRHVDQAENYQVLAMQRDGSDYTGTIPAAYTQSRFALEYFFELRGDGAEASLYPGFVPELTNQPYFLVRSL